jgi:hypothetical protein
MNFFTRWLVVPGIAGAALYLYHDGELVEHDSKALTVFGAWNSSSTARWC